MSADKKRRCRIFHRWERPMWIRYGYERGVYLRFPLRICRDCGLAQEHYGFRGGSEWIEVDLSRATASGPTYTQLAQLYDD